MRYLALIAAVGLVWQATVLLGIAGMLLGEPEEEEKDRTPDEADEYVRKLPV